MRFWDASAVVPLLVREASSSAIEAIAASDPSILVWWATEIECASALARLLRDGDLPDASAGPAFNRLARLSAKWDEVDPNDSIREAARRFVRVHPLRAAEAHQLAAAFVAAAGRPSSLAVVTLDDRLGGAARKEGFQVLPA